MLLSDVSFLGGVDYLYISMIATWLSICVVYLAIDNSKKNVKRYLTDVIAFTINTLICLGGILYFFLNSSIGLFDQYKLILVLGLVFLLLVALGCEFIYFHKHKKHFLAIFLVTFFCVGLFMILLYFKIDFFVMAVSLLSTLLILTSGSSIILKNKMKSNYTTGLFYTMAATLILLVFVIIGYKHNPSLVAFIEMIIILLVSLSFFIFYGQTYSKFLNEKDELVVLRTELLKKAEEQRVKVEKEAEKEIKEKGLVNQDTKIENIHKFEDDINQMNIDSKSGSKMTHLLMLNLDNYRLMYNTLGYKKTIEIMIQVANELKKLHEKKGILYHISNDKFIIALVKCSNEECGITVRAILDLFNDHEFFAINLKPYIGFTNVESRQINYEGVLKELELASSAAQNSSEFYAAYNYDMYKKIQRRIGMENVLRNACENQTWELYLQPKVWTATNKICGAEGLIRWKGQEGKISPSQFIPLAEEMGLIVDIGKTIIHKGFNYAKTIADALMPEFVLAVNLSAYQLMRKDFVQYVVEMVRKTGTNPKNITFEITETSFIDNMDRVRSAILELRNLGFHFSLDDFGTGYSSIGYLSKFELDEVKFDKDFTSGITDKKNRIILETVTSLAQKLGYKIVTEGIETKEQLELVRTIGCEVYQGYFFSKPISFEDFVGLLKKNLNGEYHGME